MAEEVRRRGFEPACTPPLFSTAGSTPANRRRRPCRRWTRQARGGGTPTRGCILAATWRRAARRPSCRCTAPTSGPTRWGSGGCCASRLLCWLAGWCPEAVQRPCGRRPASPRHLTAAAGAGAGLPGGHRGVLGGGGGRGFPLAAPAGAQPGPRRRCGRWARSRHAAPARLLWQG